MVLEISLLCEGEGRGNELSRVIRSLASTRDENTGYSLYRHSKSSPTMFYILLLKCSPTPGKKTACTPALGVLGKLVKSFSHILCAMNSKENQQPETP